MRIPEYSPTEYLRRRRCQLQGRLQDESRNKRLDLPHRIARTAVPGGPGSAVLQTGKGREKTISEIWVWDKAQIRVAICIIFQRIKCLLVPYEFYLVSVVIICTITPTPCCLIGWTELLDFLLKSLRISVTSRDLNPSYCYVHPSYHDSTMC